MKQVYDITKIPNYKLYFLRKNNFQKHTYNKPLTSDCGVIIVTENNQMPETFDVCIFPTNSTSEKMIYLNKLSFHIDPMLFSLLFPGGDLGWSTGFKQRPENNAEALSILQHYSYRMAYRPSHPLFNPILYSGRLTQGFFIHAMLMIDNNRMNFFRHNQQKLRME